MESTTKKVILPTKGICNASPDKICNDNELLDAVGLTYFNDALRPIQKPYETDNQFIGELRYVHRLNDGITVNYINVNKEDDDYILLYNNTKFYTSEYYINSINSIGNTIIVNTSGGLRYFLWKYIEDEDKCDYFFLGNKIPKLLARPLLHEANNIEKVVSVKDMGELLPETGAYEVVAEQQHAFIDTVVGVYSEVKNMASRAKRFSLPFFVRFAFEMYDGTYYMPTSPILMWASIFRNTVFTFSDSDTLKASILCSSLNYSLDYDYSDWSDIINKVSVFVTKGVELYDTNPIVEDETKSKGYTGQILDFGRITEEQFYGSAYTMELLSTNTSVLEELAEQSVFYHISDLPITSVIDVRVNIKDTILENIEQQITFVNSSNREDYYSNCELFPNICYTFNNRLNLTHVSRSIFEGFNVFMPYKKNAWEEAGTHTYDIAVLIQTSNGMKIARETINSPDIICERTWFFYPDPLAKKVIINGTELTLKPHTGLNGAYYMGTSRPRGSQNEHPFSGATTIDGDSSPEYLGNYVLQSEVDNPFVFLSSGYVRVGQGEIIGMAGLTTALSQDAYKISTTIVFTTQGIWAVTADDSGQYKAVAPPFSREVCINADSITMVDNAVYFVSDKGLMLITDDGIQCVSEHLAGKNPDTSIYSTILGSDTTYADFLAFLKDCRIAYDYRDSQLILTNNTKDDSGVAVYGYHWVYNIKTGTFSRFIDGNVYKSIVTDYPDTLLQKESSDIYENGKIFSLIQEPNVNDDTNTYSGFLVTRPLKFEESIKLKSLRELIHIDDLDDDSITLKIYASNDCRDWHLIPSLGGRGFKYFIFRYDFTNLRATDSFSGSLVGYDTRETSKVR